MKLMGLLLVLFIFLSTPVLAADISGTQFLERCSLIETMDKKPLNEREYGFVSFCLGYITGYVSNYNLLEADNNLKSRSFCLPTSGMPLSNKELALIVIEYLKYYPEKQHLPVSKAVHDSLVNKFPCR
jgi:hypothetical protein